MALSALNGSAARQAPSLALQGGDVGVPVRGVLVEQHVHGQCVAGGHHVARGVDPLEGLGRRLEGR